jgi:type II secretory pathway pseudopilin PulG
MMPLRSSLPPPLPQSRHKCCAPVQEELNSSGFTLLELLVIITVIALLISLRLPALARATDQSKRAQCASNLRQFALAMHIFANDNIDLLPTNGVGFWAWDTSPYIGSFVESTGSKWTVMYCPGTSPRFTDTDNWEYYNFSTVLLADATFSSFTQNDPALRYTYNFVDIAGGYPSTIAAPI